MNPPANYQWQTSELEARRIFDAFQVHYAALTVDEIMAGRFVAFALVDGSSDQTAYDTHADAVASIKIADANRYLYMRLPPPPGPPVQACDVLLWYGRRKYDAGYRPAGVHEGTELILPNRVEMLDDPHIILARPRNGRRPR